MNQATSREANTTHITYKDGMQLIHFPNNQMEKHYPDGSREVGVVWSRLVGSPCLALAPGDWVLPPAHQSEHVLWRDRGALMGCGMAGGVSRQDAAPVQPRWPAVE